MRKYLYDAAVCAAVILAAALLIVFPTVFKTKAQTELYVEISVDGKTEKLLPAKFMSFITLSTKISVSERGIRQFSSTIYVCL